MDCEAAWAAGLYDGEGSISLAHGWMKLQLKMVERAPVDRFAAAVGVGRVYGPYSNISSERRDGYPRKDFYVWTHPPGGAVKVLDLLWPWLSEFRQKRALELGYEPKYVKTAGAKAGLCRTGGA